MDKNESEKRFHNKIFKDKTRSAVDKFYSVSNSSRRFYLDFLKRNCVGKRVLEYGCGPGSSAFFLAKNNAIVTGIDISDYAISLAKAYAEKQGAPVEFHVMDAEHLGFEDNSLQLVCGSGIIHHLQLHRAFAELSRTLTPDGKAIFLEPLGHNPVINFYRKRTPQMRTDDEHPLLLSDIRLAHDYFKRVEPHFFHLCSLAAVPLRDLPFFNGILSFFEAVDRLLFRLLPFTRKHAWTVALVLSEPRNSPD